MSILVHDLNAWHGHNQVLHAVNVTIPALAVTAIIGPSGSGKSTFVRCLNRLHETQTGARVSGSVHVGKVNIYAPEVRAMDVRRQIGMVFQQPNPLPTHSIFENVAIGARLNGLVTNRTVGGVVEECLRQAALWDEVKDRLYAPATQLSGGQQQRLCIARALAVRPTVLLMDEPCSALDPIATLQIEQLIDSLKDLYTIVIVTHNIQQAGRISDRTVFFLQGHLIEEGTTEHIFRQPQRKETEQYITGRFG